MKVFLFVVLAIACALADEEPTREKKDVVVGSYPYNYGFYGYPRAYTYGYDDGKYYPGKYEKAAYVPSVPTTYSAGYPYSYSPVVPYSYGAYPYQSAYSYGSYPYNYGAFPYVAKPVVY